MWRQLKWSERKDLLNTEEQYSDKVWLHPVAKVTNTSHKSACSFPERSVTIQNKARKYALQSARRHNIKFFYLYVDSRIK